MTDTGPTTTRTITVDLVRHAPTLHDKTNLPPYDVDADTRDHTRITALAHALPQDTPWWVSPLTRCRQTADALKSAGASPQQETVITALEEQRYGTWHDQPVVDIWEQIKNGPKSNWHFLHPSVRPPQGESFDDLITRLAPVIDTIISSQENHIVIIAHAMVIKALTGMAMGLDNGQCLALKIDYLSRTTLTYMAQGHSDHDRSGGRWSIDRLNQIYG